MEPEMTSAPPTPTPCFPTSTAEAQSVWVSCPGPRSAEVRARPTLQGAPGSEGPAGAEGRGVGVGLESPSRSVTCPKTKKRDGSR